MKLTAAQISEAVGGDIVGGAPDAAATSFTIDSRLVVAGACFIALEGARDGHDYVLDAFRRGAALAVVRRTVTGVPGGSAVVRVADPMTALSALGRLARARLADATIVGVTGSAGKTATKDLTAAALRGSRRVHASPASYNNETGLPLTLLGAADDAEVVVTEMGARFAGNITELTAIARPSMGVVTHVGMAHAAHLGGRDGIARVKGELLEALPPDGLAVLNAGCDATPSLAARTAARVLLVGREHDAGADIRVRDVMLDDELRPHFMLETPWGSSTLGLSMRGEHQVENAAMAAAVALELDAPLESVVDGLQRARTSALRMEILRTADGVTLINDSYNSSPTSAAAAVRSLARLPVDGRRIAVLGEMLELGQDAGSEHAALGALAASLGIDLLIAVGEPAASSLSEGARGAEIAVRAVPDAAGATALLTQEVHTGDAVLVKASRAVGLEQVADDLVRGRTS